MNHNSYARLLDFCRLISLQPGPYSCHNCNEILRARTALEIMAVDHMTGELVMAPVSVSFQAEYNEPYILWAGPVSVKKMLKKSDPLLCDFTDADGAADTAASEKVREEKLDYPFRYEMEKRNQKGDGKMKK